MTAARLRIPPQPLETVSAEVPDSLDAMYSWIRSVSPQVDPSSSEFRVAVLLLAALRVGQNTKKLARFTGYPEEWVARCARRLIDNGVWQCGRTVGAWGDLQDGARAFGADVEVGSGRLCRRVDESGWLCWAPPGQWYKDYDYIGPVFDTNLAVQYRIPPEPVAAPEPAPSDGGRGTARAESHGALNEAFPEAVWLL